MSGQEDQHVNSQFHIQTQETAHSSAQDPADTATHPAPIPEQRPAKKARMNPAMQRLHLNNEKIMLKAMATNFLEASNQYRQMDQLDEMQYRLRLFIEEHPGAFPALETHFKFYKDDREGIGRRAGSQTSSMVVIGTILANHIIEDLCNL